MSKISIENLNFLLKMRNIWTWVKQKFLYVQSLRRLSCISKNISLVYMVFVIEP